jgi:hypothetical protein
LDSSGLFVIVSTLSGIFTNITGTVVVQSGAGILVQTQSGAFITLGSGVAVVASGISVQLLSGLIVTQSGGIYPSLGIGGEYLPTLPTLSSGMPALFMQDVNGRLIVTNSGQTVTVQSGLTVTAIASSPLYVTNTASSPLYVQSGLQIVEQSGRFSIISGQNAVVEFAAGVFNPVPPVITSGQPTVLQTDANGFLMVNLLSGSMVTQSGGYWPSLGVGGGYTPVLPTLASGGATIIMQDVNGRLIVTNSGQTVTVASGLFVQAVMSISGIGTAVLVSGLAVMTATTISGNYVLATASSPLYITNAASSPIYVQSGLVITLTQVISGQALFVQNSGPFYTNTVYTSSLAVGTSGVVIQGTSGAHMIMVKLMTSGLMWIGTLPGLNSGAGFMLAGDPTTNQLAGVQLPWNNAAGLGVISMTSTAATAKLGYMVT